jgi:membrane dipeptidase
MGLDKKYNGYKSYAYLEKDTEYKVFRLAREIDRVDSYLVPLSPSDEERVKRIVAENPIISLHDHPHVFPEDITEVITYSSQGRMVTAYEALSRSCLDCVFDNLMDGGCHITSKSGWKWTDVLYDLGMRLSDIHHQDFVTVALKVDDILRAHREGRVTLVMCLEGATPIENELERIEILYGLGIRLMGLVYNDSNALGTGLREDKDGGLTHFGRLCVERMNKLGMAIDVAHCSDQTILDTVMASRKPVIDSHVGARALYDIKRLKADHVLQAIADKGGLIGIEAAPHTTLTKSHPEHDIESVMEHFEYIKNLVGIEHVGFGPDTIYGDHVGLHRVYSSTLSMKEVFASFEGEVSYVRGLENPTEASWNIVRWLVKRGYSDKDIANVIGGNAIRFLRDVWH